MAVAVECDRCGEFEQGFGSSLEHEGEKSIICTKCQKEFQEWWNKGKKIKQH